MSVPPEDFVQWEFPCGERLSADVFFRYFRALLTDKDAAGGVVNTLTLKVISNNWRVGVFNRCSAVGHDVVNAGGVVLHGESAGNAGVLNALCGHAP